MTAGGPLTSRVRTALARCALLTAVPPRLGWRLVEEAWIRTLADNEALYVPGEPGDAAFVVEHGRVAARLVSSAGDAVDLAVVGPGSLFGHLELLDGSPRSCHATAVGDASVVVLPAAVLATVIAECPAVLRAIAADLARIVRAHTEAAAERAFLPAHLRLAAYLRSAADAEGRVLLDGTQSLLAQRLGVTRQTVSRALRLLGDRGLVTVHPGGRCVTINDLRALGLMVTLGDSTERPTVRVGEMTDRRDHRR